MVVRIAPKSVIAAVLDLLVGQKLLKPAEATFLRSKYLLPQELAAVLLQKKVVAQDQLAKIFATVYNLAFVRLQDANIPQAVLTKLPYEVAARRLVVAYEETPTVLKLAVAEPYRLSQTATGPLHQLGRQAGKAIELAVAPRDDIMAALSGYRLPRPGSGAQSSLPRVDLERMVVPAEVLKKFPHEVARKYQMVVFEAPTANHLKVAAVTPSAPNVREMLRFLEQRNGVTIELYQTTAQGLEHALASYPVVKPGIADAGTPRGPAAIKTPAIEGPAFNETDIDQLLGKTIKTTQELRSELSSAFVPRILGAMLSYAVVSRASDIHLEPMEQGLKIRYRVDGQLSEIIMLPAELHPPITSRIKILAGMKIDERRIPQDGRFTIRAAQHDIDIRTATLPTIFGEKIVLRLLDKSAGKLTLEQIGLKDRNLAVVQEAIKRPWGIILSTGPTGSGKTTTLYAILQKLSTPSVNIITLEDPIEYEVQGVNQSQVRPKIGFSFADGLRSVLRQDPNIIMVGEIRDRETAELVTQAALTGHIVLTTLHTNDAASAIPRLINIGVEPFLITSAINAVVAQRLVRQLCPHCRKAVSYSQAFLAQISQTLAGLPGVAIEQAKFYGPTGCPRCRAGYQGRIGIFEAMPMSQQLEQAALLRQPASALEKIARSQGMITMRQDGILKAAGGITSLDEVWKATSQ